MPLVYKQVLSALSVLITIAAFVPYICSIRADKIKPHSFSWLLWGIATSIVFVAQVYDNGGAGAWSIGFSALIQFYIAYLAHHHRGDSEITRGDWIFLIMSLGALPAWVFTSDPFWAVAVVTAVDFIAYGPSILRAYHRPHQESLLMFSYFAVRNFLVILALEHYSPTTLLFPISAGSISFLFVCLIGWRRRLSSIVSKS